MDAAPGSVVEPGWLLSPEGRQHRDAILHKDRRRIFGLLERPVLPPPLATATAAYKLFVSGKSGVGKTALVAKLVGAEVPAAHHETLGIEATTVYWPAKLRDTGRPVMFQLDFWDCGEAALKKFDHILPACKEEADGVLFLFSFTDRSSFEDLPGQMARVTRPEENLVRVVVGTKYPSGVPLPFSGPRFPPGGHCGDPGTWPGGIGDAARTLVGGPEGLGTLWGPQGVAQGDRGHRGDLARIAVVISVGWRRGLWWGSCGAMGTLRGSGDAAG
uniref:Ciliogenesis and planar polarity effector 2 n=1 Tax=Apteryx owenii TaxID=8824 RepID=A0A8B9P9V0_APTOW